jgi:beta-ureidopropionase / N-carbamoyl-L-amino-acid hydrolase
MNASPVPLTKRKAAVDHGIVPFDDRFVLPEALAALRIDGQRLLNRITQLGEIGPIRGVNGEPGSARLALTDEDREGRDLVTTWMHDLGLAVRVDAIGNVIGVRAAADGSTANPVMTGSHIDTVRTGGLYDGNLGVLAGLEIIETLDTAGIATKRPIAAAFFTNEEGARFNPDMMGSLVYCGGMSPEEAYDVVGIDGARVGDELARIGYLGPTPCPGEAPHAFVELHIEQGPVLEAEGVRFGAVTGVQGISWQELTITGQSNHAGTTPMSLRHDAGYAAARIATFVRELALEMGHPHVGTVGQISLHPNLVNVVAATAVMTVDLRNTNEATLAESERRFGEFVAELALSEGVTITSRVLARFEPVAFDERVIDLVEHTIARLGNSGKRMPSGAGHDAQMLARMCPTAMIFTQSHKGISHNPAEFTEPADLVMGTDLLLQVMLTLSETDLAVSARPPVSTSSATAAVPTDFAVTHTAGIHSATPEAPDDADVPDEQIAA